MQCWEERDTAIVQCHSVTMLQSHTVAMLQCYTVTAQLFNCVRGMAYATSPPPPPLTPTHHHHPATATRNDQGHHVFVLNFFLVHFGSQ